MIVSRDGVTMSFQRFGFGFHAEMLSQRPSGARIQIERSANPKIGEVTREVTIGRLYVVISTWNPRLPKRTILSW